MPETICGLNAVAEAAVEAGMAMDGNKLGAAADAEVTVGADIVMLRIVGAAVGTTSGVALYA